jgi:hypothetical protein
MAAALVAGVLNGLARRQAVASGRGYASPTAAWLGKRLALAGAFAVCAWGTAAWPVAGILWPAAGALLAGAFLYVGNLPPRV